MCDQFGWDDPVYLPTTCGECHAKNSWPYCDPCRRKIDREELTLGLIHFLNYFVVDPICVAIFVGVSQEMLDVVIDARWMQNSCDSLPNSEYCSG